MHTAIRTRHESVQDTPRGLVRVDAFAAGSRGGLPQRKVKGGDLVYRFRQKYIPCKIAVSQKSQSITVNVY